MNPFFDILYMKFPVYTFCDYRVSEHLFYADIFNLYLIFYTCIYIIADVKKRRAFSISEWVWSLGGTHANYLFIICTLLSM